MKLTEDNMKLIEVCDGIVQFIRAECRAPKSAVVGISGGLDSAVVASLAVRALGSNRVYGVLMFDRDVKNTSDYDDALLLCENLGLQKIEVDISMLKNAFLAAVQPSMTKNRLLVGNGVARLRMNILYAYANWYDGLVLGTGDKSEWLMGFFTKHGDGGCDIAPILDLYKTEVRKLAKLLQVPASIINKPSSPNLWPGQTAESDLGYSYEEIDSMLRSNTPMTTDVSRRLNASEHKRRLPRTWVNCLE